ncbi:MAG: DUF5668 domain-containing protein [Bacteroidales bacterium]|nr:DUF5668 domain-containing protein [Bacteroidales bacterium]
MSFKKVFWSVILIIVGALFLLCNLNVIDICWSEIWKFWPFIIVLVGVSILPIKDKWKIISSIAIIVLWIVLALTMGDSIKACTKSNCDTTEQGDAEDSDWRYSYKKDSVIYDEGDSCLSTTNLSGKALNMFISYDKGIKTADIDMEVGAGEYHIFSCQGNNLATFVSDNSYEGITHSLTSDREGDNMKIDLTMKGKCQVNTNDLMDNDSSFSFTIHNGSNTDKTILYELGLHEGPIWDLDIDAGATKIDLDGRNLKIRKLTLDDGVSSSVITLGSKEKEVHLDISSAVSKMTIKIPADAYCEIDAESVLNLKNFRGFKKTGDGRYVTNAEKSNVSCRIYIQLDSAVSKLDIEKY